LTVVNPIKGGYVTDYSAIIGSPGFFAPSINADPYYVTNPFSNAAFLRHEANFLQYWSPTLFGLSFRAGLTTNEMRQSARTLDDGTPASVQNNPYVASVAAAFEWEGLRARYAWESHHDYYGMAYIGQSILAVPAFTVPTANDWGNKLVLDYTLTLSDSLKTRFTGVGEYLLYKMHRGTPPPETGVMDNTAGVAYRYARPAFYAQVHQTIAEHNIWGAYARAFAGECSRFPMADGTPAPCVTDKVGAEWIQAGYLYQFTKNAAVYLAAYRLRNERSGLYFTAALSREGLSPGLDQIGGGLGVHYTWGANLLE
jgi:predicted porin